jgi:hypothetical protein
MGYIIEIQKIINSSHKSIPYITRYMTKYIHVGYMNVLFKNTDDCISYFDNNNSSTISFDKWSTNTYNDKDKQILRYRIRDYNNEELLIPPFNNIDIPNTKVVYNIDGTVSTSNISYYNHNRFSFLL